MNISAKVRVLVTALSALWLCWIGWGPHTLGGMDLANAALDRAGAADSMLIITAIVGLTMLAALFLRTERLLTELLLLSLIWWVYIAIWLFLSELPTAAGFTAIGSIGGFVAYWNAIRE